MFDKEMVKHALKDFIKQTSTSTYKIKDKDGTVIDYHLSLNFMIEGESIIKDSSLPLMRIENADQFIDTLTILLNKMSEFHARDKDYFEF